MKNLINKTNAFLNKITEIIKAGGLVLGVLIAIYHGIYKLNQTVNTLITSLPIIENNMKFADINVDYDILLAEKQLSESGEVDRILMRKLLLYKKDLTLNSAQLTSINYIESKTRY